MSVPAENAFWPAPVTIRTRNGIVRVHGLASLRASSRYISKVQALRASGRLMVIGDSAAHVEEEYLGLAFDCHPVLANEQQGGSCSPRNTLPD